VRGRIALLSFVVLFAAVAPAEAAERRVQRGWLGVTVDGPFDARDRSEWRRMGPSGVETVRAAFVWSLVQPRRPGTLGSALDFSSTDELAVAAARHGIRLLPVIQAPPRWAAVPPWGFASPPADLGAVRDILAAFVERYGPHGSLWSERPDLPRRPIRAWQVFNEPNLEAYWRVQPFARDYVATLKAAAHGIRSVDPGATVVLGGLTNRSWRALTAIYHAGGRGAFDAVAIHPYSSSPERVVRIVRYARRVMRRRGDRSMPIWVTEFSWPATSLARSLPDWAGLFGEQPITNSGQARLMSRTIRLFVAERHRLGIGRLIWYTWLSREGRRSTTPFDYAGLRRTRRGVRRNTEALRVFRRWARRLEGCAKTTNAERCRR
jgi:polysaccharide biosynthesis protein PslG